MPNNLIEKNAFVIFNDVMSLGKVNHKRYSAEDWAYRLGATFGVALGNAISDIIEDTLFK